MPEKKTAAKKTATKRTATKKGSAESPVYEPADDPTDPEQNPAVSAEHVERDDGMIFPAHGNIDAWPQSDEQLAPDKP